MKYSRYYENVVAGTKVFNFNKLTYTEYSRWTQDCTEWLRNDDVAPTAIAEWVTLDNDGVKPDTSTDSVQSPEEEITLSVKGAKAKPFAKRQPYGNETDSKDYIQLLDKISRRYLWLAKFPSGKLPSKDEKLLAKLEKKLASQKKDINFFIEMGINCIRPSNSYTTHDSFHLWLRTTSDFFQQIVPDSGLSAEWLSLPTITTYVDKGFIGGSEIQTDLIMAIKERLIWISETLNIKISSKLRQVDEIAKNFLSRGIVNPPLEDLINFTEKIKWKKPLYFLGAKLHSEAFSKNVVIKDYFKEEVKKYVDKNGKMIDGEKLLSNFYAQCSNFGSISEVYERTGIKFL